MNKKQYLKQYELEDMFSEYLTDTHENVEILGISYPVEEVLENVDPIAFREYYLAWLDDQIKQGFLGEDDGEKFYIKGK